MWIDMLCCAVIISGAVFLGVYLYRLGLRDGRQPEAVRLPMVSNPLKPTAKEAPEVARISGIMRNIDSYDGTNKGQVKIDG